MLARPHGLWILMNAHPQARHGPRIEVVAVPVTLPRLPMPRTGAVDQRSHAIQCVVAIEVVGPVRHIAGKAYSSRPRDCGKTQSGGSDGHSAFDIVPDLDGGRSSSWISKISSSSIFSRSTNALSIT